jgi:carboxypeptidase family protein
VALIIVLSLAGLGLAQTDTARLFGTITDSTGALIPNATVTVVDIATGRTLTVKTGTSGEYVVNALPIGKYHVEAKREGFKTATADVTLEVSQVLEMNLKLETGAASVTIDVTNSIPLVDTATSSAGEVIQGRQVVELPLNGRNFTSLALLTPGVSRGNYSDNAAGVAFGRPAAETWRNYESGGASLAVNGLRPQANNYLMDGIDNNDSMVNTIVIFPAIEDIAEFKTTTSVPSAEFGRAGGGVVQVSTKSGTNDYHGALYWFNRSKIAAADVFQPTPLTTPPTTFRAPELSRNQFGASLGGPIWKSKLFAFVDYQGWRQNVPAGVVQTRVPTALMRQGNFTELLSPTGKGTATTLPYSGLPGCSAAMTAQPNAFLSAGSGYIFDPQTCLPFGWNTTADAPGPNINIIPTANQITAGMNYLNAFPNSNISGANVATNSPNFTHAQQNVTNMDDYDARIDFVATSKDSIFARYSLGDDFLNNVPFLQDSSHFLPSGNGTNPSRPRQVAVGYTHILTNTVINEFHYGYIKDVLGYQQPDSSVALAKSLGIQNANTSPLLGGMPIIGGWYGNLSYVGDGGPYLIIEPTQQFSDSVSWIKGKHTFKFGASLIHRDVNWDQGNNAKGYFWIDDGNFGAYPAPTSGHGTFTGYETSELVAGFSGAYVVGGFSGYYQTRSWENGFFVQDDFRATRKLTLNLGLRYDLFTWPSEAHNHMSNFNPTTGELVEAGAAPGYNASLIDTPKHNFGPRIGFAYDLFGTGKTVIRGGYGLFYYLDRGGVANELSNNPDFNGAQTFYACPTAATCGSGYRFTFAGAGAAGSTDPTQAAGALPPKVGINPKALNNTDTVIYYPKNSPNSHIQQWNVQVEQALGSKTSFDLAYVGTKMGNLSTPFNANQTALGSNPSTSWFPVGGAINPAGVGAINEYAMIGSGNYNGLQAKLTRMMSNGLTVTGAYTWSHTLDNSASSLGGAGGILVGANGTPLLKYQSGNSNTDQRQLFSASTIYELPFGRGKTFGHDISRPVDYVIGGWQWQNVLVLESGTPMDISGAASANGRPDYHGGCSTGVSDFIWIKCSPGAFTNPAGLVGTLAKNFFPGPGTHAWDMSLTKVLNIAERVKTEFRAQVYNLTNTPQFNQPDTNYKNGDFGQLTSPRLSPTNRELELALRITF